MNQSHASTPDRQNVNLNDNIYLTCIEQENDSTTNENKDTVDTEEQLNLQDFNFINQNSFNQRINNTVSIVETEYSLRNITTPNKN